ncbi:MAG: acetamidase/formamidase family protein, partial [Gaiellales bacterium]
MARTHYFPPDQVHFLWDVENEPVLTVESGDTVVLATRDVTDDQIGPDSTVDAITGLDRDRLYPLAGPIGVAGAVPGDTVTIEILDLHTRGWGWTGIIPGLGLLSEEFTEPYLRVFDLTRGDVTYLRDDIAIPVEPFLGTMGVCPAGATSQAIMPPGTFGGTTKRKFVWDSG